MSEEQSNLVRRRKRLHNVLKPSDPYPIEMMSKHTGQNTICDTLREIYNLTDNEEVRYKARVCMTIAKKMQDKLEEYKSLMK